MILRPRHFKAIELLTLTDMPLGEVAAELEISTATLRRWRKDEVFCAELARWQRGDAESFRAIGEHALKVSAHWMIQRVEAHLERPRAGAVLSLLAKFANRKPAEPQPEPEPSTPEVEDDELTPAQPSDDTARDSDTTAHQSDMIAHSAEPKTPIATQECRTDGVTPDKQEESRVPPLACHSEERSDEESRLALWCKQMTNDGMSNDESNNNDSMTNGPLAEPSSLALRH